MIYTLGHGFDLSRQHSNNPFMNGQLWRKNSCLIVVMIKWVMGDGDLYGVVYGNLVD